MVPLRTVGLLLLIAAHPVMAQGIDCAKPRGGVERGICASPRLLAQDGDMARAYARATADPAQAAGVRTAQIAWIRARDAACGKLSDAHALEACLTQFATQRLAQLAPPTVSGPTKSAQPTLPIDVTAVDELAAPAPPAVVVPAAEASLDRTSLPAAEQMETLLHVAQPGRFAIAAKSATGTALQLVDMLTGPSDTMGVAGEIDGRIDALLDVGTYKIRAFASPQASGDVQLSVTPFLDAAPPAGLPARGRLDAELGDFQQRRFWLEMREGETPRIEAAGRALADLRLFRNGEELVDDAPSPRVIEPTPGHPLTRMILSGKLEPGVYEVVAYGGPPLAWPDGAKGQPFHLRGGVAEALAQGWVDGRIGPMGSEVFRTGAQTGALRLELPQPAAATLQAEGGASASIARNSREPVARLDLAAGEQIVTLRGAEGQPYRLRAMDRTTPSRPTGPATLWTGLSARGLGGDEPPATGLLARLTAGQLPYITQNIGVRVGPGLGWRRRFNLRGPLTMLLEATGAGKIVAHGDGVAARIDIAPLREQARPRADGAPPTQWDLAVGWYVLSVTPRKDAAGIYDLAVGPPDALPTAATAGGAPDPEPSFGLLTPEIGEVYAVFTGTAAGGSIGLIARPAPIDLAAGPLGVTLAAGAGLEAPVRLPADGDAAASEIGAGPIPATFDPVVGPTAGRIGTLRVDAADHERTVAIFWRRPVFPPAPVPSPPAPADAPTLVAGQAHGLDLDRDEPHGFALDVPQGGLYRVETLGRLRTAGAIGTAFIPTLDQADGNGVGSNMLIQRFLRAGRYRVTVTAHDSDGHLAVAARPATVATGATLVPGGRVRARMAADGGVVFPVEIATRGTYHLDLLTLGAPLTARLEDADGWPILPAGDLSSLDQDLRPGRYRLLVQPSGVSARVVARLAPANQPDVLQGHGPFPLAFASTRNFTWREPAGRDDARAPDVWTFSLAGPSPVSVSIGDGMVADLRGEDGAVIKRFTHSAPFVQTLPAGAYRVEATSLGRNDRLDYTLALASDALQPDAPRQVKLPVTVRFAIAQERVVSLTSFGSVPVRAVLKRGDGSVIGRYGERGDDWNIAVARRLPAGAYTLDVASATPPTGVKVVAKDPVRGPTASADESDQTDSDSNSGDAMTDDSATPQQNDSSDSSDTSGSSSADSADAAPDARTVELRLALQGERAPLDLTKTMSDGDAKSGQTQAVLSDGVAGMAVCRGGAVCTAMLPAASPGQLLMAMAFSDAELAMSLERQGADGVWRSSAVRQRRGLVMGVPADGARWRVSVWTIDGGAEEVRIAGRVIDAAPQEIGRINLVEAELPGFTGVRIARVKAPGGSGVRLIGTTEFTESASGPGRVLARVEGGMVLPQSDDLWLSSDAPFLDIAAIDAQPDQAVALAIPETGDAMLPGAPVAAGRMRVWLARSGLGQPGLDAGHGMGVATDSALALGGEGPARVFNAGGDEALRLLATPLDLSMQTQRALDAPFAGLLRPHSATPVRLPDGMHVARIDLAPGTAAIADWQARNALTEWAGDAPVSRSIEGAFTDILLVNTGAQETPVALSWTPMAATQTALAPGVAFKRFFGAAGSLDMPIGAAGRLMVAGGAATLIGADGRVSRGAALDVSAAGRVVIDHGAGLLVAWVEGGASPWPTPPPQSVTLPARMAMGGMAMALDFDAPGPMLLNVGTTAPVILAFGDGAPILFPAGAEFHRAISAGPATLRLISPHDGPLSGTVELDGEPIAPAAEGVGEEVALAPGGSAAFGFEVTRAGPVGVGVRAEPDRLAVRLLREDGALIGEGVAQLQRLVPGRYVLEASVPPDGATTLLRPAIVGIARRPNGPPPDVVNMYLALAGRAPVAVVPAAAQNSGATQ